MRKSGILLPVASLPGKYGIGTFGKEAYRFVDRLKEAGQSFWQILPLGATGYGDSPYQSFSTFAGNPYYIDLESLVEEGLLTEEELAQFDFGDNEHYIDYEKIYLSRFKALRIAYENCNLEYNGAFWEFVAENRFWLEDYALFMAIKNHFDGASFSEWDEDIRLREEEAMVRYKNRYDDEINFFRFQQFCFMKQWKKLKKYANDNGVEIIGDIPIYVAFDSADTWSDPKLFQIDETGKPKAVAGCPPDAFTALGQLWGNPLYDWKYHAQTGYEWWKKRMLHCRRLYDVVRVDHFRGFDSYYAIPYGKPDAREGFWEQGPGMALFDALRETLGETRIIAEDLGFLTPSVLELVKKSGFPGMKVLQFAFDPNEPNDYLPHNYHHNCVVYTGTHDNNTLLGWLSEISPEERRFAREYMHLTGDTDEEIAEGLIRLAMSSVADICIVPIQEHLGKDGSARINKPATLGDNWKWRMTADEFTDAVVEKMRRMTWIYGRLKKD
ncbi:MAG: 4-alpha-glucanotransferase [Lachnospiraceae bacterium]|nr:4-alpha-glucanotransferase [Lachnospiraceae bacterium]